MQAPKSNERTPPRIRSVMLVDDDPVVCAIVEATLSARGYPVTVRSSPLGTSAEVARKRPEVVILDVDMPGISGEEVAAILVRNASYVPALIFHSSRPASELQRMVSETGALGAIPKGNPRAFLAAFESLLATRP